MARDIRHSVKVSNYDFDFFFNALEEGRLVVQKCADCGHLRNPPGPMCPSCRSFGWSEFELNGGGTIFTYTVHHHPKLPEFETPHVVVAAEMDEGVRVVADLQGLAPGDVQIGKRVKVEFYRRNNIATFRFVPRVS